MYGISAWNVRLEGAIQSNLVITPPDESPIQVDNLEVAQFIYLLLNNEKIRSVIDTITSKVVLILAVSRQNEKSFSTRFETSSASAIMCRCCSISRSLAAAT